MKISEELIFRAFLADRLDLQVYGEVNFVRFEEHNRHQETIYGLNSRMLFGRIVYSKDGQNLTTESLAIKQTPAACFDQYHCQLQFASEIHFFAKVLPFFDSIIDSEVDLFFPKFLYSFSRNSPAAEQVALIFENLRDQGFVEHQCSGSIFLDYSHLSLVMRHLGHFHGYSLMAAKINPTRFQQLANFLPRNHELHLMNYSTLSQAFLDHAIRLLTFRDQRYASRLAPLRKISQNLVEYLKRVNNSSLEVICHGDFLATNLLFRYEGGVPVDVKALDLGLWRFASPVLDLAHAMYMCADQQTRDQHWDDLISDYRRGLSDIVAADEVPSMDVILEEFRKHCWYGIMIASHYIRDQNACRKKSPRILDIFKGVNLLAENITSEEILRKIEDYELGGTVATEMVFSVIKDMIDRKFI